jgi:hypothetical protein
MIGRNRMKMRFDGPNTNKNLGTEERKATEANSQMCSGGVVWSPTLKEEGTLSDFRLFQATEPLISTSENYFVATPAARRGVRATPPDGVNFIPYMKLLGVE